MEGRKIDYVVQRLVFRSVVLKLCHSIPECYCKFPGILQFNLVILDICWTLNELQA